MTVDGRPAVRWAARARSVSGVPLGEDSVYINRGTDAVLITCQWRLEGGHRDRVEQGCDDVLGSLRIEG